MKASIIIAHDPRRGDELLHRALRSIQQDQAGLLEFETFVETEGSISAARNRAAAQARGEILIFLDDDLEVRSGFFREILAPFQDPKVGIVGGVNVAFPQISFSEEISASLYSSVVTMARSVSRYTPRGNIKETDESEIIACAMAVRKTAFVETGGFPLDIIPCEENVLINRIQRAGWKVMYNPFAVVFHKRPAFPAGYARAIFHYGKGRGMMLRHGAGAPRMLWQPSKKWLYLAAGVGIHYAAYFAGVLFGFLFNDQWEKDET
jgi:glycosyltransferase involved in cell wall biosynthesis